MPTATSIALRVVTCLWASGAAAAQDAPLHSPFRVTAGDYVRVASGDLDADGALDLVFSRLDGTVDVTLGVGDGTFRPPVVATVLPTAGHLAVAELTGDGRLDVAVLQDEGTGTPGVVTVLPGRGDGTFGEGRRHEVAPGAVSVSAVDLDGVAPADLVVASLPGSLSVLVAAGEAAFSGPAVYPLPSAPRDVAVGDVDHDGVPDLLVAGQTGLWHLTGVGGGAFREPRAVPPFLTAYDVELGDPDLDGDLDALLALSTASIPILENLGGGALSFLPGPSAPLSVGRVRLTELDGDGRPDLVVVAGGIGTYLGDGALGFARHTEHTVTKTVQDLLVEDLDGDGLTDVGVGTWKYPFYDPDVFTLLEGTGTGSLRPTYAGVNHLVFADVDGDGRQDVVSHRQLAELRVHRGLGDGVFAAPVTSPSLVYATDLHLADVDEDGLLDVLVTYVQATWLQRGLGGMTFDAPVLLPSDGGGVSTYRLATGDVDQDGHVDYVEASSQDLRVYRGNGSGGFSQVAGYNFQGWKYRMQLADLDADGDPDLVVKQGGSFLVRRGGAGGKFTPAVSYALPGSTAPMALGDLDDDGDLDVALVDPAGTVAFFTNAGDATFAPGPAAPAVPPFLQDVAFVDLDQDGATDLLTTHRDLTAQEELGDLAYHRGLGGVAYAPPVLVRTLVGEITVHDVDDDGDPDVVLGGATIHENLYR